MKQVSTKKRLASNLIWNILGLIFNKGFATISSILVARFLGTTLFGEYGMINSTISMFATFAGLGLGITATKFIAEFKETNKAKVERVLGLTNLFAIISGIVISFIVFISAEWLSINQLNNSNLASLLQISSILLFINTYNGVQRGAISGFESFSSLAKVDAIIGFFTCTSFIIGTIYWGITGLIIANVLVNLISVILCHIVYKNLLINNDLKINYKEFYVEFHEFLQISLPSLISGVMVGPVMWYVNTLFIQIPNGYSELGLFNAANQWKTLLQLLPNTFNMALLPILISFKNEDNNFVEKLNMILSWLVVIVIGLLIINIPDIISLFYGKDYISYKYSMCIVINVLTTIVLAYKEGMAREMLSQGHMWRGVADNLLWAISLIISVVILRKYGSIGYSFSYLIAYVMTAIVFIPYNIYKKTIKRENIFNKYIFIVWIIVIIQSIVTIIDMSLSIRLTLFFINIIIYLAIGIYLLKKYHSTSVKT